MNEITAWSGFYTIVGSAAGALIGLQFVVMTLIANRATSAEGGAAFGTPTIVHFSAVLLLSAGQVVPWTGIASLAIFWGVAGLCGTIYAAIVTWRMKAQTAYHPEFEDWLCHAVLPLTAYVTLAAASFTVLASIRGSLMAVAAASLLLLFTSIHNSWDTVTYHVFTPPQTSKRNQSEPQNSGPREP